jgi:hypothetical protein
MTCPECGSPECYELAGKGYLSSPGDRVDWWCDGCSHIFSAEVPEPKDTYAGDGIFADNH